MRGNGAGEHYVVEADESRRLVRLPRPAGRDRDQHRGRPSRPLRSLEASRTTFVEFMGSVAEDGVLVVCADDARRRRARRAHAGRRMVTYGFYARLRGPLPRRLAPEGIGYRFEVDASRTAFVSRGVTRCPASTWSLNATAALAAAWALGLDVARPPWRARGVHRRAPSVRSGRRGRRRHRRRRLRAPPHGGARDAGRRARAAASSASGSSFQPHRYSRTEALAEDFGDAFADADRVVSWTSTAPARRRSPASAARPLLDALLDGHPRAQVAYFPHRADVVAVPRFAAVAPATCVMTMGAGDVTTCRAGARARALDALARASPRCQ